MKYGADFDLSLLSNQHHDIAEVLIRRELTAPSSPHTLFRGQNPDSSEVATAARYILRCPARRQQVALRADCIHAAFGVIDYLKNGHLIDG